MNIYYVGEDDSNAVAEKFNGISARFYQFGTYLKIPASELDDIKNETSIRELLQEVVREFVTSDSSQELAWRTIVNAVFDINPALARKIAEDHPGKNLLCIIGFHLLFVVCVCVCACMHACVYTCMCMHACMHELLQ